MAKKIGLWLGLELGLGLGLELELELGLGLELELGLGLGRQRVAWRMPVIEGTLARGNKWPRRQKGREQ